MSSKDSAKTTLTNLLKTSGVRINGPKAYDIRVHDDRFYKRVFSQGSLGIGESYMDGWWDCDDMAEMFNRVHRANIDEKIGVSWPVIKMVIRSKIVNMQTGSRSKRNASAHYDIGNELYTFMLGKRTIYSCGYWKNAKNLDDAQEAKLDLICRKLKLKKGMKVLDIGCGWGGFAEFASRKYGVKVTGITPAAEQVKLARERTRGLPVQILQKTYQELARHHEKEYDAIVSIGMLEHVGNKNWAQFFSVCKGLLKDNGTMLHHTIGSNQPSEQTDPWVHKYIFPGGVVPSLGQLVPIIEKTMIVEDVHNFGPYYDETLSWWWKNFEKNYDKLKGKYDERFYRMWRFYLMTFAGMFRARKLQLWQIVIRKTNTVGAYERVC